MELNIEKAPRGSFFEGFTYYLLGLLTGIGCGIAGVIIFYLVTLSFYTPSGGPPQAEDFQKMFALFGKLFLIFFLLSIPVSLIFNIVKALSLFKKGRKRSGHTVVALTIGSLSVILLLLTPILLIF